MDKITEVRLYDADSLEYSGSIQVNGDTWEYVNVTDSFMVQTTTGMPLKAVLSNLIIFNIVYDIIEKTDI